MPKSFSEHEREAIRASMQKIGGLLLRKKGVKHVTIEDIAKGVSIANGSFYAFYKSREELFWDIIKGEERQIVDDILAIAALDADIKTKVHKIFFEVYLREGSIVFSLTRPDIEYITRKIPPDVLQADAQNSYDLNGTILSLCRLDSSRENVEILGAFVSAIQYASASPIPESNVARQKVLELLVGAFEDFCSGGDGA